MEDNAAQNLASDPRPVQNSVIDKFNRVTPLSMFLASALLVVLPVAAFFFGMYYQAQFPASSLSTLTTPATSSAKKVATAPAAPKTSSSSAKTTGTITGHVSYPASMLPADEQVCAQDTTSTATPICITVVQNADLSYSLSVPAGTYYVYATANNELKNYKAYYDQFSVCGNSASCPASGHTFYIAVKVTDGATVPNIDPGDWYKN